MDERKEKRPQVAKYRLDPLFLFFYLNKHGRKREKNRSERKLCFSFLIRLEAYFQVADNVSVTSYSAAQIISHKNNKRSVSPAMLLVSIEQFYAA